MGWITKDADMRLVPTEVKEIHELMYSSMIARRTWTQHEPREDIHDAWEYMLREIGVGSEVKIDGTMYDFGVLIKIENSSLATDNIINITNHRLAELRLPAVFDRCAPETVQLGFMESISVIGDGFTTGGYPLSRARYMAIYGEYQERYDLRVAGGSEVLMEGAL